MEQGQPLHPIHDPLVPYHVINHLFFICLFQTVCFFNHSLSLFSNLLGVRWQNAYLANMTASDWFLLSRVERSIENLFIFRYSQIALTCLMVRDWPEHIWTHLSIINDWTVVMTLTFSSIACFNMFVWIWIQISSNEGLVLLIWDERPLFFVILGGILSCMV